MNGTEGVADPQTGKQAVPHAGDAQAEKSGDEMTRKVDRMSRAVRELLECLGEDPEREGLVKTPHRVAKALLSVTAGYHQTPTSIVGDALFECSSREMVLVRDIECNSLCEHHMLPFFGRVHVAYLPEGKVVGLSKLARLVDCFAKRLQIQERMVQQIAEAVASVVGARGVAVMAECTHMCMTLRGVQKPGATTVTSSFTGLYQGDSAQAAALRGEFFAVLGTASHKHSAHGLTSPHAIAARAGVGMSSSSFAGAAAHGSEEDDDGEGRGDSYR